MHTFPYSIAVSAAALALLLTATPATVSADPPSWAPAHGHRDKHDDDRDDEYRDYDRRSYPSNQYWGGYNSRYATRYGANNYGIHNGTCNHAQLGGLLGSANPSGVLGNTIGNAVSGALAQQGNPLVGAIAGAVVNQMLGNQVGQLMDPGDRACFSQSLEYGYDKRPVTWLNSTTNNQYQVVPVRSFKNKRGRWCREVTYQITRNNALLNSLSKTVCRKSDGSWQ